ncbi:MAG: proprotein convertase P-domain-containing protein, partial [Anaerolineae bacterium]
MGTTFALMQEDLYAEWVDLFLKPGPGSEYLDAYDRVHRPLGAGSVVTYTLRVENRGTMAAEAVQAYVSAYYALSLPGATQDPVGYREVQTIDLGSIAPGAAVTHVLTGVVSGTDNWRYQRCLTVDGLPESACSTLLRWASLDSLVFDSVDPALFGAGTIPIYPPVEWLWAEHAVDIDPPLPVGIDGPRSTVGPGVAAVRGYAVDPSGTPLVEVEVRDGLGTTTLICPDETPDDGRWDCEWAVSGSDGDLFDLRARAVDALGHASGWTSPWRTVILDSTPPTVTLDGEVQLAVQDQIIGPDGYLLEGTFADTYSTGSIEVCRQEGSETTCDPAGTILSTQTLTESAHVYDDVSAVPLDLSGALCGGGEVTRTIWVSDSFIIGDTNLGLNVEHPHRDELIVDLFSPVGTHVRVVYGRANTAETYANYDVWLDDAAEGNLHNSADDDLGEPLFDRSARPDSSLDAFAGEDAQGVWTMRICDLVPGVNDGRYNRARLALTEQGDAVAWGGTWHYALPT